MSLVFDSIDDLKLNLGEPVDFKGEFECGSQIKG